MNENARNRTVPPPSPRGLRRAATRPAENSPLGGQAAIGLKIRERRAKLGMSQTELAERLGISPSYLNLIERNKRNIAARLMPGLAQHLRVDVEWLDGESERRLAQELRELAGDPILRNFDLDSSASDLVARSPEWARALVALYRAYMNRSQAVAALSDRLNQDPYLGDAVHTMLTKITAIRSAAEILETVPDLDEPERTRFQSVLFKESTNLSGIAEGIAQFFDTADTDTAAMTPAEEVDDFIVARDNYIEELEEVAGALRAEVDPFGAPSDSRMTEFLERRLGVTVRFIRESAMDAGKLWNQVHFDPETRIFSILESAAGSSYRFQLARLICRLRLGDPIRRLANASPLLRSAEARERASGAMASYSAACLLMPYDAFRAAAEDARYDIEFLARKYGASFEQICHRLVSLKRPGSEGVPFAFMRTDPAGFVTKRMPLPRLPLPRYGNACPLWAVYNAFQTPGAICRQIADFPNGERFLFVARAQGKVQHRFNAPRHLVSVMVACDALYADRTIYADGLDLSAPGLAVPVGPSCRLCARRACIYREEAPIHEVAGAVTPS